MEGEGDGNLGQGAAAGGTDRPRAAGDRQRLAPDRPGGFLRRRRPGIEALLRSILEEEAAIERFFAAAGIAPMHVVYEELVERYAETTGNLLRFLGIEPLPDLHLGQPRTIKLADDETEEWVARFEQTQSELGRPD